VLFSNSFAFNGYPQLSPTAAELAAGIWQLQGQSQAYTLQLQWEVPATASEDDSLVYVLDTSLAASQAMVAALAGYMLEDTSSSSDDDAAITALTPPPLNASVEQVDSYQIAMALAAAGAAQLFSFDSQTLSADSQQTAQLQACTQLHGGILVALPESSFCLSTGQLYQLRLRGGLGEGGYTFTKKFSYLSPPPTQPLSAARSSSPPPCKPPSATRRWPSPTLASPAPTAASMSAGRPPPPPAATASTPTKCSCATPASSTA
jgi:hypothetical protein